MALLQPNDSRVRWNPRASLTLTQIAAEWPNTRKMAGAATALSPYQLGVPYGGGDPALGDMPDPILNFDGSVHLQSKVVDPADATQYVQRHTIKNNQSPLRYNGPGTYDGPAFRSMLSVEDARENSLIRENGYWMCWAHRFYQYPASLNNWDAPWGVHYSGGAGFPGSWNSRQAMQLFVKPNGYEYTLCWGPSASQTRDSEAGTSPLLAYTTPDTTNMHYFVSYMYWSTTTSGRIIMWRRIGRNGSWIKVVDYTGPTTAPDGVDFAYVRFGHYAPGNAINPSTYTHDWKGWSIFDDVTPASGEPVLNELVMQAYIDAPDGDGTVVPPDPTPTPSVKPATPSSLAIEKSSDTPPKAKLSFVHDGVDTTKYNLFRATIPAPNDTTDLTFVIQKTLAECPVINGRRTIEYTVTTDADYYYSVGVVNDANPADIAYSDKPTFILYNQQSVVVDPTPTPTGTGAVFFDANTDAFKRTAGVTNIASAYTVMFDYYHIASTGAFKMLWYANNNAGDSYDGIGIDSGNVFLRPEVYTNTGIAQTTTLATDGLSVNTWYTVAVVRESATVMKVYLNGALVSTVTTASVATRSAATEVWLGASHAGFMATGRFDNYREWTVALNSTEIAAETTSHQLLSGTNVKAVYLFDGANSTLAAEDLSGNSYTWTAVGTPTVAEGYTVIAVPPVPTNIQWVWTSATTGRLSWTKGSYSVGTLETKFNIYRTPLEATADGSKTLIASTANGTTFFYDWTPTPSTDFWLFVSGENANGEGTRSVRVNVDTRDYVTPVNPTPNTNPTIISNGGGSTAAINLTEGNTLVTSVVGYDPDVSQTIVYSINGGTDAAKFTINASNGELRFATAPSHASPTDSNTDNVYVVSVAATDGTATVFQVISVTVLPVAASSDEFYVSAQIHRKAIGSTGIKGIIWRKDVGEVLDVGPVLFTFEGLNFNGSLSNNKTTLTIPVPDGTAVVAGQTVRCYLTNGTKTTPIFDAVIAAV